MRPERRLWPTKADSWSVCAMFALLIGLAHGATALQPVGSAEDALIAPTLSTTDSNVEQEVSDIHLIITCAINPTARFGSPGFTSVEARRQLYNTQLRKWLEHTTLPVVAVESSGEGFPSIARDYPSPRFHQIVYNQTTEMIRRGMPSKNDYVAFYGREWAFLTSTEMLELRMALEKLPHLSNARMLFKVSGKYYIPQLASELRNIPTGVDIVRQHSKGHTEIFGFTPARLREFLQRMQASDPTKLLVADMEGYLDGMIKDEQKNAQHGRNVHALPPMPIPAQHRVMRSDGTRLSSL